MKKSGFPILSLVLAMLVSFLWTAENTLAAKLVEVRTGKKSGFTRLVFQFESPPRFQVQDKATPGQFSITFLETTSGLLQISPKYVEPVENIAIRQDDSHLKAVVALSIPHFSLKPFTLTQPHRVIIDLYPASAADTLVTLNKLVVKESAETGPTTQSPPPPPVKEPEPSAREPEPSVAKAPQPPAVESEPATLEPVKVIREPEPAPPVEKASGESRRPTAVSAQPSSQPMTKAKSPAKKPKSSVFGPFQRNLILILAGISIIILALIGFLLMQKKNSTEKGRPAEPVQELKTTADIMASIDARIKEKFKQYEEADQR